MYREHKSARIEGRGVAAVAKGSGVPKNSLDHGVLSNQWTLSTALGSNVRLWSGLQQELLGKCFYSWYSTAKWTIPSTLTKLHEEIAYSWLVLSVAKYHRSFSLGPAVGLPEYPWCSFLVQPMQGFLSPTGLTKRVYYHYKKQEGLHTPAALAQTEKRYYYSKGMKNPCCGGYSLAENSCPSPLPQHTSQATLTHAHTAEAVRARVTNEGQS